MKRKTSSTGFNLIRRSEQFRAKPYLDAAGVPTIGYGHTRTVTMRQQPITIEQAILLLKSDVQIVEYYINLHFNFKHQCQFDALVSLLYNIGTGTFHNTKLYALLQKDPEDKNIADEWIEFRNAGGKYLRGLMRRRIDELAIYYSW